MVNICQAVENARIRLVINIFFIKTLLDVACAFRTEFTRLGCTI